MPSPRGADHREKVVAPIPPPPAPLGLGINYVYSPGIFTALRKAAVTSVKHPKIPNAKARSPSCSGPVKTDMNWSPFPSAYSPWTQRTSLTPSHAISNTEQESCEKTKERFHFIDQQLRHVHDTT